MIEILCLVLLSPLIAATSVFIVETGLGMIPPRLDDTVLPAFDPRSVVVLVPAHDEEIGIAATLRRQRASMPDGMRLMVVADNCDDRTAELARAEGVEVVERRDPARRGKGFALDFGRASLVADPPACVVVVDADTVPALGALSRLASRAIAMGHPIQAAYIISVNPADGSTARLSAAAFFIKNMVRQLGGARIGAPTLLTGSGMAFPWALFAGLPLATGHVAEDLMLGVHCSRDDHAPRFDPLAVVTGTGSSDSGTAVQRRRWESGFFQVAQDSALPLMVRGVVTARPGLLWLGLHLVTPPLILLLAIDGFATTALFALAIVAATWLPFLVMLTLSMGAVGVILGALAGHRRLNLLRDWTSIARYLGWKLRLSVNAFFRREKTWIRTDRD